MSNPKTKTIALKEFSRRNITITFEDENQTFTPHQMDALKVGTMLRIADALEKIADQTEVIQLRKKRSK